MQREITSQADKKSCLVISQWTASCKVEEKLTVHMPKGQSILNIVKCSEEPIYFICWHGMCNITNVQCAILQAVMENHKVLVLQHSDTIEIYCEI